MFSSVQTVVGGCGTEEYHALSAQTVLVGIISPLQIRTGGVTEKQSVLLSTEEDKRKTFHGLYGSYPPHHSAALAQQAYVAGATATLEPLLNHNTKSGISHTSMLTPVLSQIQLNVCLSQQDGKGMRVTPRSITGSFFPHMSLLKMLSGMM